jgi:phage regulator Rha-like protein
MSTSTTPTEQSDQAVITSLVLADFFGIEHKALLSLIKKHQKALEKLAPTRKQGSGKSKVALPTETQCNFLLTVTKNTERTIELKLGYVCVNS